MKQNTKSLFNLWSEVVFASALTFRQAWNYYQQQTTLGMTNICGQVAKYYWCRKVLQLIVYILIRLLCHYLKALQQSYFSKILNQYGCFRYFRYTAYKGNLAPSSSGVQASQRWCTCFLVRKLSIWLLGPECWTGVMQSGRYIVIHTSKKREDKTRQWLPYILSSWIKRFIDNLQTWAHVTADTERNL